MSMWKPFARTGVAVIMLSLLAAGAGCKKNEKFKVPDIKIITTDNVHFVQAVDDDNIWISTNVGQIFHSNDGGQTFTPQSTPVENDEILLTGGEFLDTQTGWIPGLYGTMLHTSDGGKTWEKQDTHTEYHLFSVDFVDAQNGWAIGEWNTVLRTADGGTTWQRISEEQDLVLSNIAMADEQHGWIVGEAGLILRTNDGGQTWERQMPKEFERATYEEEFLNPRPGLFCVQAVDADTAFACGLDAHILRTTDGGTTWQLMQTESRFALYSVYVKNGKGWAIGDKGAYLTSEDSGETWHLKENVIKSKQWFSDVSFSSPEKGWVVGQSGIVTSTTDGGLTWQFHSGLSYDMEWFEMPKALEFRGLPAWGPFARQ